MKKSIPFLVSLLTFILLIFSCDNTSKISGEKKEREIKQQISSTISGKGDKVETVRLNKGLAIFSISHSGSRNFIIWLKDQSGKNIELLVNDIGSYNGQKTATLREDGTYILEVQANGNWTINVK
jgi:lipopolysaccharide export LptBFGC system permease protein LptF